ncbi:MAG: chloride channel protein [Polyangiaceae bacterium]
MSKRVAKAVVSWVGLGLIVGSICGSASALFLHLLDLATHTREQHEWLVYLLPVSGLVVGALYERFGTPIRAGNNLIIDTIHDDGPPIPIRMAPMVLLGTVLTHLFGGSAGREGTAVQMGASLADTLSHRVGLSPSLRKQLLAAGVAGGFGSVFGTPIAGTIFGLEFVVLGKIEYDALLPALVAATVGDMTTRAWGIGHTEYPSPAPLSLSPWLLAKWHSLRSYSRSQRSRSSSLLT